MASTISTLKIGLIPADGIGKEVIPAARAVIQALGSDIPRTEFVNLDAGFECFAKTGTALPDETVECVLNYSNNVALERATWILMLWFSPVR